jgi:hypothetical protein
MKISKDFLLRISIKNLVLVEAKSDSARRGLELESSPFHPPRPCEPKERGFKKKRPILKLHFGSRVRHFEHSRGLQKLDPLRASAYHSSNLPNWMRELRCKKCSPHTGFLAGALQFLHRVCGKRF